jgi:phage terminase small subunit
MCKNLTPKQKRFIEEYLIDLNATRAAIAAGYKEHTAARTGSENLQKPDIQEALQEAIQARSERTGITADRVLEELWHIATDDIKNYLDFRSEKQVVAEDLDGEPIIGYKPIVDLKDSRTIDTRNISEISCTKDGSFKFKMYCKDVALVNVGKHLGMFTDKLELTGKNGGALETRIIIDGCDLDDDTA